MIKRSQKPHPHNNQGFTLVELLLVIALIAISVTVTGDIMMTLMRSYTKTNVINEIEQESNFVGLKLERDLRNATDVTVGNGGSQMRIQMATSYVYYNYANNNLYRSTTAYSTTAADALVSNTVTTTTIGGVNVGAIGGAPLFEIISPSPVVVSVKMRFYQAQATNLASYQGEVQLVNTFVIRNSY